MILNNLDNIFEYCLNENGTRNELEIEFSVNSQKVIKKCKFNYVEEFNKNEDKIKILDGAGEVIFSKVIRDGCKTEYDKNNHLISLIDNGKKLLTCEYLNDELKKCKLLERTEYIFEYDYGEMTNYFENEDRDGSVFSKYHKFEYETEGRKKKIIEKVYLNDFHADKDRIIKRKVYDFFDGIKIKEETDFLEKDTKNFGYKEIRQLSDDLKIWIVKKESVPEILSFSKYEEELIIKNFKTNQNWYFEVLK